MREQRVKLRLLLVPSARGQSSAGPLAVVSPNPALNLAPFGRWTLRDKAAQRRLAPRYPALALS